MAHHQKHNAEHDALISRSLHGRATPNNMPAITEDETAGEADEPPDHSKKEQQTTFTKSFVAPALCRRESLLTLALTTDTESCVEEDHHPALNSLKQAASVSSTCSTYSGPSVWDFTSDDGQVSAGTRASTPGSPHSMGVFEKQSLSRISAVTLSNAPPTSAPKTSPLSEKPQEGNVEATLGRKRCITFACANKATPTPSKQEPKAKLEIAEKSTDAVAKRPCTIKFACPFKGSSSPKAKTKFTRHLSPAPPVKKSTSPYGPHRRFHRDSDTTIRNASPMPPSEQTPTASRSSRFKDKSPVRGEKFKCHIFASSDGEEDDWIQESTVHRSRLTVDDTLVKENRIRRLAEEAEEEEALEDDLEDLDDTLLDDEDEDDDDELVSDEGFDSDDEEGFAESDDENDSDSDYEWWTPRRVKTSSPFIPSGHFIRRPLHRRTGSGSSMNSLDDVSPRIGRMYKTNEARKSRRKSKPLDIKIDGSDLPDSTDFVCGTLDEDRPMEEAFIASLKQSQAAKHRAIPQDIDPTFPTSDPEMEMDEEDDDDEEISKTGYADTGIPEIFGVHSQAMLDEEFRGRKPSTQYSSPLVSPKRPQSPAVKTTRRCGMARSPAPIRKMKSPSPTKHSTATKRTKSPRPSARGSPEQRVDRLQVLLKQHSFLGPRNHRVTHTSSLPRSPAPIGRKLLDSAAATGESTPNFGVSDIEDDGEPDGTYARKAIDIKQGLEHKRLRRRQKLYSIYCHKSEKKKDKRPASGKGADRMRQVGISCAKYRGKRMMSL